MSSSPHRWVFETGSDTASPPFVLLHGSYGTEADLLPMADRLAPGASRLGVRGTVALGDGYSFFRRHPDRRVDEADLRARVPVLADLVRELTDRGLLAKPPVVVGFSNGAIMAAALLAACPEVLVGAILFRPLSPFTADALYRRSTVPVLIVDGAQDRRRDPGDGRRLAERLSVAGVAVTHRVLPAGHAITAEDEEVARDWLGAIHLPHASPEPRGVPR
ncbi:alpha/beta hydrolase [Microlunatus antarcticus]|uniref:Phospholipase/carboxylesterase n=1 Tax=Microlunatus antarcticus TaxID=53388 RepID=A0A7W5JVU0_9ACTN|nr:dienelactone hydrolase family protein [Microlunatus antarcticus]MBB3326966.1 phospholipase/carboxylesterase [Microlunatus antarcticus]